MGVGVCWSGGCGVRTCYGAMGAPFLGFLRVSFFIYM